MDLFSYYYFLLNEEKSRVFMCLQIEDRVNRLVDIVTEVDNTLIRFSKQDKVYYSDPKFHVSILLMKLDDFIFLFYDSSTHLR